MKDRKEIAMIAAVGPNLELGRNGDLVWHISADLRHFKELTTGHPVIMGRKTWESLPKRPLPGRKNIVLTRSGNQIDGAVTVSTPEEALEACRGEGIPFVMGGADIYRCFMPEATVLYITRVDDEAPEGVDSWFPEYRTSLMLEEASEWMTDKNGIKYRFETWRRD